MNKENGIKINNFIRGALSKEDLETTIKILLPVIFEKAEFKNKEKFLELMGKYYDLWNKEKTK
jgi:hypothetical protein